MAGCGAISAHAQQAPTPSPARAAVVADTQTVSSEPPEVTLPERDRKDVPWKSFSEVTKNARVQSGLFTEAQAVRIVERLVDGDLPRIASGWVDYVDSAKRLSA